MDARDRLLLELNSNFPHVTFQVQNPPSYISSHTSDGSENFRCDSHMIFCYRKTETTMCLTPKKAEQTTIVSEVELTGSPLKLDMDYDKLEDTFLMDVSTPWSPEETSQESLCIDDARNIINFYNSKVYSIPMEESLPLWVVCDGQGATKTLSMAGLSYKGRFNRGMINYLETIDVSDLSIEKFKEKHLKIYGCNSEQPSTCIINGIYRISGRRSKTKNINVEFCSKNHNGMTQLECEWTKPSLQVPAHEMLINLFQEIIVGHDLSVCSVMWKSVCAIQGISKAVVNLSSISNSTNITGISIRPFNSTWKGCSVEELENKLKTLLTEVEEYNNLLSGPKGGCICIPDNCTSLQEVFRNLNTMGSSNDFTYRLWDILKECDTIEDLINILVVALKSIYKKNLRPCIDPGNTTFLGSLVKKLARGVSKNAVNSLSILYKNPIKALNIIAQLGIAKMGWEYTNIFSLIDNTLAFNNRLKLQNKISEVNEDALNKTLMETTIDADDVTINPFDPKFNLTDSTMVQDGETSFTCEGLADLTLDNFASFKKHNLEVKTDRLPEKDQPLFSDGIDVEFSSKEWKYKTMRLAQLQVCMEHICRAQLSLNLDFNSLKTIIAQLLKFYTCEKSPIKTVDQLHNEPVQSFMMPVKYRIVKEHLEFKHANLYRIKFKNELFSDVKDGESSEPYQTIVSTFVCSQQQLFPSNVFTLKDTDIKDECGLLYYYCTHYLYLSNKTD